ncbi:hypothetical protein CCR90_08400 [Rhodovulum sulfidophilum]|uniref:hypothetical protein n=1 Tax=Rhodovulum sulfidophilum TaxID=35806 RepID=UPI0019112D53|nr:hypothetical protein [Rhodovulum sulfidophilum]MBK5923799.1 hypothetical protein [Rhodovulum sulfidophilum]
MTQGTYLLDTGHTKAQAFAMLQGALSAIQSGNAGATPPAETAAGMLWVDTATRALKMRNIANNGWITLGSFASGTFVPAGVNQLTEAQATDPTGTAFGAVSGEILKAVVEAFAPAEVRPRVYNYHLRDSSAATGAMDLTDATCAVIRFVMNPAGLDPGEGLQIRLSSNGGASWTAWTQVAFFYTLTAASIQGQVYVGFDAAEASWRRTMMAHSRNSSRNWRHESSSVSGSIPLTGQPTSLQLRLGDNENSAFVAGTVEIFSGPTDSFVIGGDYT